MEALQEKPCGRVFYCKASHVIVNKLKDKYMKNQLKDMSDEIEYKLGQMRIILYFLVFVALLFAHSFDTIRNKIDDLAIQLEQRK